MKSYSIEFKVKVKMYFVKVKMYSYFEMYFNCIFYDNACWLFCVYYDGGLCRRETADPSISYPSLLFFQNKKSYFKCERSRRYATESLCSPKINTKMPTRTENVDMN